MYFAPSNPELWLRVWAWYQFSYHLAKLLSEDLLNAIAQLIAIRILKM